MQGAIFNEAQGITTSCSSNAHISTHSIPVTWSCLPHKSQLFILFLCRVSDFLQIASLQSYVFYQLKFFAPTLPDSTISWQAGILHSAFPGIQCFTAVFWGHFADVSWIGRKNVLLLGLVCTGISCLGFGFSKGFIEAVIWRLAGGVFNGTVSVIRTMISENMKEQRYISHSFLLLPLSFYVATLVGPVLGGCLSNPLTNYPEIFGPGTILGGPVGIEWMRSFPYSLPSIISASFMFLCAAAVFFGLKETLASRQNSFDCGLYLARIVGRLLKHPRRYLALRYSAIPSDESVNSTMIDIDEETEHEDMKDIEMSRSGGDGETSSRCQSIKISQKLPRKSIWTKNFILTLITQALYDFHLGAFNTILIIFLCTPRSPSSVSAANKFASGLSFSTQTSGLALSLIGIIGIPTQLLLYPLVQRRLGTLHCYQLFAMLFPLVYMHIPFLVLVPHGRVLLTWTILILFLIMHTIGRVFTLPATICLLNNCAPSPALLGGVHGIGQSVSAAFRTLGSVIGSFWYAWGLGLGVVGLAWWLTAGVTVISCVALGYVREDSEPEISLLNKEMSQYA